MTPPRAILFDLGNTLVGIDWTRCIHALAPRCSKADLLCVETLGDHPMYHDYERGRVSTPQFYAWLSDAIGFSGSADELERAYCSIFVPWPQNEAIAVNLAARLWIGVASNTSDSHMRAFTAKHPFLSGFKGVFFSYRLGCRKPEPDYFAKVIEALPCAPGDALFIDDLQPNVDAAAHHGFRARRIHEANALSRILDDEGVTP